MYKIIQISTMWDQKQIEEVIDSMLSKGFDLAYVNDRYMFFKFIKKAKKNESDKS